MDQAPPASDRRALGGRSAGEIEHRHIVETLHAPLLLRVAAQRRQPIRPARGEPQSDGKRHLDPAFRRQAIEHARNHLLRVRAADDGGAHRIQGGLDERRHPLRSRIEAQPAQERRVDDARAPFEPHRVHACGELFVNVQQAGSLGGAEQGQGVAGEAGQQPGPHDQALGGGLPPVARARPLHHRRAAQGIGPAGQRMEMHRGAAGVGGQQRLVARSPSEDLAQVAVPHARAGHRAPGVAGSLCPRAQEDGLLDLFHGGGTSFKTTLDAGPCARRAPGGVSAPPATGHARERVAAAAGR